MNGHVQGTAPANVSLTWAGRSGLLANLTPMGSRAAVFASRMAAAMTTFGGACAKDITMPLRSRTVLALWRTHPIEWIDSRATAMGLWEKVLHFAALAELGACSGAS